ncbi:Inner membrane protein [Anaerovibrio sp. JC8]|uniref:L-cysteine desulfidase family protein n=1 Tax=Anaerovibrio sp. JC8 TaxID=1240085 RepID=UPI000A0C1D35|nr:L-serine ammonia-lyase, iron-sulfur-dependent, subunit alpha [Anaerovibrio sp. JC8]ORU01206.1 Inner membrane protein [Anaerovibrio sp. JC8]
MEKSNKTYKAYIEILKRELVPAMGCTEPIAIAYCAAKAREALGGLPDHITVAASGNIIKNVKSVIVPNTNGRKGIEAAAAIGVLAGDANAALEVIAHVKPEEKEKLGNYMDNTTITVEAAQSDHVLDIIVTVSRGNDTAQVQVVNEHTNIVKIRKNDTILFEKEIIDTVETGKPDYECMTIEDIFDFAMTCDLDDVKELLDRQIKYNTAISDEGLKNDYGANIGKTLLKAYGNDIHIRARARAAAGSDARMNGCEMPVVINSGSGNQGMTVSLPVIEYAKELGSTQEELYRALLLSNLVTLHEKEGIGRLSAYCGAISAGAGAGAGIAWLCSKDYETVIHTIVNALAITSGIVCDGAKASCAAKISAAVDAGIMGFEMYRNGQQFYGGDGLVLKGVENTIRNISRLGRIGMKETDKEIIKMMIGQ